MSHVARMFGSLVVSTLLTATVAGCASEDPAEANNGASDSDVTSRTAQVNALRVRVQKDFSAAPSLKGYKLVFVVTEYQGDATRVFMRGRIQKRDSAGRDSALTEQNIKESVYGARIDDIRFQGDVFTVALEKKAGTWSIMRKGAKEAYLIPGTPAEYGYWNADFGIPNAWMGLEL